MFTFHGRTRGLKESVEYRVRLFEDQRCAAAKQYAEQLSVAFFRAAFNGAPFLSRYSSSTTSFQHS